MADGAEGVARAAAQEERATEQEREDERIDGLPKLRWARP